MKKTILTLVLAVWATITFSQYAYSLSIGIRNNASEEFTWGENRIMEKKIPVRFEGKDITIYTEETQYYQTLMPEYEVDGGSYWFAYDVNMKKCKFFMVEIDGYNYVMIEYDDVCIVYGVNYN
jgi:hypothetical protein